MLRIKSSPKSGDKLSSDNILGPIVKGQRKDGHTDSICRSRPIMESLLLREYRKRQSLAQSLAADALRSAIYR